MRKKKIADKTMQSLLQGKTCECTVCSEKPSLCVSEWFTIQNNNLHFVFSKKIVLTKINFDFPLFYLRYNFSR